MHFFKWVSIFLSAIITLFNVSALKCLSCSPPVGSLSALITILWQSLASALTCFGLFQTIGLTDYIWEVQGETLLRVEIILQTRIILGVESKYQSLGTVSSRVVVGLARASFSPNAAYALFQFRCCVEIPNLSLVTRTSTNIWLPHWLHIFINNDSDRKKRYELY